MLDAEAVFFVYDQQPQILKCDVFCKESVGAYDYVYLPLGQLALDLLHLSLCAEARKHFNYNRVSAHSLPEVPKVLLAQYGCRAQHGHLFARHRGAECRPHCNLGFTEPDVCTQEPVHRARRAHIAADVLAGFELVGRLSIREGVLKALLPIAVGREAVALRYLAPRLYLQEFRCVVESRMLGRRANLNPRFGIQAGEFWNGLFKAYVSA